MKKLDLLKNLKGKLIVSCQALEGEPLYGSKIMAKMALAAKFGGAAGIRANGIEDIVEIKKEVDLPIVGLIKRDYNDSEVYITPTIREIEELNKIGVEIIATDFTGRVRPDGQTLENFVKEVKDKFPNQIIMADISTFEEALMAEKLGADIISTTMSGYTSYSKKTDGPDIELVKLLSDRLTVPLICEGRIHYPYQAQQALKSGAFAVIVGGAITRPLEITMRFVDDIKRV